MLMPVIMDHTMLRDTRRYQLRGVKDSGLGPKETFEELLRLTQSKKFTSSLAGS